MAAMPETTAGRIETNSVSCRVREAGRPRALLVCEGRVLLSAPVRRLTLCGLAPVRIFIEGRATKTAMATAVGPLISAPYFALGVKDTTPSETNRQTYRCIVEYWSRNSRVNQTNAGRVSLASHDLMHS